MAGKLLFIIVTGHLPFVEAVALSANACEEIPIPFYVAVHVRARLFKPCFVFIHRLRTAG
jgi:hypothetical protein